MAEAVDPMKWEDWLKQYNQPEDGAAPVAGAVSPATVGSVSQSDLNNIRSIMDPNFGRTETMTHGAEAGLASGVPGSGFAGNQTLRLLDSEKLANWKAANQMLEPYLARDAASALADKENAAKLNQIAAEGAAALQRLQLSEAGQTARLNAQEAAEAQRQIIAGQQAMQQLTTREAGETGRLNTSIGGNLASTLLQAALGHGAGGGSAAGGGASRVPGVGSMPLGATWDYSTPQYGATPTVQQQVGTPSGTNWGDTAAARAAAAANPLGSLGSSSIDMILRRYGLLSVVLALLTICAGCNTSTYERKTDGTIRAVNSRWFWSTESYEVESDLNGFKAKARKSNPDAASIEAAAYGTAKGLGDAAKGK